MSKFMSDADIAAQYDGFKVTHFEIKHSRWGGGWHGVVEIEFPNADEIDFDSSTVESWISYDQCGERLGFSNYYPEGVEEQLSELIRSEIKKRL